MSDKRVISLPDDLTEEEAIELAVHLDNRFGWAGTFYTRRDAETLAGQPLTDEQWERLRSHTYWNTGVADAMCEYAGDVITDALNAALPELDDEI